MTDPVRLALYKRPGRWVDKIIRVRTSSPYSHCEVVVAGLCFTSSNRDGGVRVKPIDLDDGWDVIDLPRADPRAVHRLLGLTIGQGYDWIGAIVGRGLDVKLRHSERWFCSQWCAEALGFRESWRFTPATLAVAAARLANTERRAQN